MTVSGIGPGAHVNQAYRGPRDTASVRPSGGTDQASPAGKAASEPGGRLVPESLIDEILEKGLMRWAQEKQMEELERKIGEQVMAELGLTKEGLAEMSDEARAKIEQRIEEMVRERLEAAIREQLKAGLQQAGGQQGTGPRPSMNFLA